jgi:hypothetical protein
MCKKSILYLVVGLWNFFSYAGTAPSFSTIQVNNAAIPQYEKIEITFTLNGTNALSFDYDSMLVQGVFSAPNGQTKTVDGFLFSNTGGNAIWKVRFTPLQTGTWTYFLKAKNSIGSIATTPNTFNCTSAINNGFVRKTNTNYLAFDNGKAFVPIGQNLQWDENWNLSNYFKMLRKSNEQGCNAIRYGLTSWFSEIEWTNVPYYPHNYQGTKQYYLPHAALTDSIIDSLSAKNMYASLSLFSPTNTADSAWGDGEWRFNPYNVINGGTCSNHQQFFTDATARSNYKNRLRYINARWGYSPNILAWEIGNEMELSVSYYNGEYDTCVSLIANWVDEMTAYMKTIDVNNHLRTLSYAYASNGRQNLSNPNIDLTQIHEYNQDKPVPNFENVIVGAFLEHNAMYKKPFLVSEYGLYYDYNGNKSVSDDPSGVLIHNALWSSMFSGSYGPALNWWWDTYIDSANLYSVFKPISKVIPKVPFLQKNMRLAKAKSSVTVTTDCIIEPQHWQWQKAPDSVFTIDQRGVFYPDNLSMSSYLFGQNFYPDYVTPFIFNTDYETAGEFKVHVGYKDPNPQISIYVDNVLKLSENNPQSDSAYSVTLNSGKHEVRVENHGDDFLVVDSFEFTNYQVPMRIFSLQSADSTEIDAYLLNGTYNWEYMRDHAQTPPPALTNQTAIFYDVKNGNYQIDWYNCSTGDIDHTDTFTASNNQLSVNVPVLAWDVFARMINIDNVNSIRPIEETKANIYPNPFTNSITIERNTNEVAQLEVTDLLGQVVFTTTLNAKSETIALSNISEGTYLINITNSRGHSVTKMIKRTHE